MLAELGNFIIDNIFLCIGFLIAIVTLILMRKTLKIKP